MDVYSYHFLLLYFSFSVDPILFQKLNKVDFFTGITYDIFCTFCYFQLLQMCSLYLALKVAIFLPMLKQLG